MSKVKKQKLLSNSTILPFFKTIDEDLEKLLTEVSTVEELIESAVSESKEIVVLSDTHLEKAGFFIKNFKDFKKKSEALRKRLTKPFVDEKKKVDDYFKSLEESYSSELNRLQSESKAHLDRKAEAARKRQEAERKEYEDSILEEAEITGDESVIDQAPEIEVRTAKVSEISNQFTTARVKRWKVTAFDKIPREFLTVDEKKINEIRKSHGFEDKSPIAGIEFYFDENLRTK